LQCAALNLKRIRFVKEYSKVPILTVGELMTPSPRTIGEDIPVSIAKNYMRRDNIRHLPVLSAGRLVGIVSDRDIKVAESFQGPGELSVGEIMTEDPYVVAADEPLDHVLLTMAEKKYGCVLVHQVGRENVVGIFTDTDALKLCGKLLQEQAHERAA
jgi:acetoin utilization protein AcuB